MAPIEKLWHTAYKFDTCHEVWYFGPFKELDATVISNAVDEMFNAISVLLKELSGSPQAKRVAEQIRMKIDKFKIYLPILEAICRQGLCERHWTQISEELGQEVNPAVQNSLGLMVDIDVMKIQSRLEEISNAAGKEYELNIQLVNMQEEWVDVKFVCVQYRDSDMSILSSVDDIQTLLDDHILKAQAMRGSPYIAALGPKATNWEDKLISMQDIIDTWLQVQATWMYLEPIFSSEDIMRQMPTEGRHFKSVDKIFRKLMRHTIADPHVIQATDFPDLLNVLRTALKDLEDIQRGLNLYLEKKRLYFARFFFLSNDELLEILSETKDPMRVQPHMKKCFEGINALQFDTQMEITAFTSVEGEQIPCTRKINPALANVRIFLVMSEFLICKNSHILGLGGEMAQGGRGRNAGKCQRANLAVVRVLLQGSSQDLGVALAWTGGTSGILFEMDRGSRGGNQRRQAGRVLQEVHRPNW